MQQFKGTVLRPSARTQLEYAKGLRDLIDQMTRETRAELTRLFRAESDVFDVHDRTAIELGLREPPQAVAMDASLADTAQKVIDALTARFTALFDRAASNLTGRMVDASLRNSGTGLTNSLRETSKSITLQMTPQLTQIVDAASQESAGLIRRVPVDYLPQVQGDVMRSITTGNGLQDLVPALEKRNVSVKNWATNVARDQTRKVYNNINKVRMQDAGVEEYEWIHSGGSNKPREYHMRRAPAGLNGGIFRFDDPPIIDERTGERGIPGQLPYCLPGTSVVKVTTGVNKLYRRVYSGELLTLVTHDGVSLQATPNHPVLTDRGWLPLQMVNVGDNLINAGAQGLDGSKADIEHGVSAFNELFDSALELVGVGLTNISGSKFQFHGDGSDNEVSVIDIDGFLSNEINAAICQKLCEQIFAWTNVDSSGSVGTGDGARYLGLLSVLGAPASVARSLGDLLALVASGSQIADDTCRRAVAYVDSAFDKPTTDQGAADAVIYGELQFGRAGQVVSNNIFCRHLLAACGRAYRQYGHKAIGADELGEVVRVNVQNGRDFFDVSGSVKKLDRVVKKFSGEFDMHVYNLESGSGWYVADDIVNHNCGCTMRPVINLKD